MLHAIIIISKILGIILLGIVLLIVAGIGLVLFVPVRYRISGSYDQRGKGKICFSWLLHSCSLLVEYDQKLIILFRILGFVVYPPKEKPPRKKKVKRKDKQAVLQSDVLEESRSLTKEKQGDGSGKRIDKAETADKDDTSPPKLEKTVASAQHKTMKKESFFSRYFKRGKIRAFFKKWYQAIRTVKIQAEEVKRFFQNEKNQELIKMLWKELKTIIRHVLPQRGEGTLIFGFDDPYTTGQVLTIISLFYGWIPKKFTVMPMFDEPVLKAQGSVRGRVRASVALLWLWRIYRNKQIKEWLEIWRSRGGVSYGK